MAGDQVNSGISQYDKRIRKYARNSAYYLKNRKKIAEYQKAYRKKINTLWRETKDGKDKTK